MSERLTKLPSTGLWTSRGRVAILVVGAALCGSALVGTQLPAGATASVTLYVTSNGVATSGCTATGASACASLTDALSAADLLTSDDVTIDVAASSSAYNTQVTVDDDNPQIAIVGAGASTTTLNGEASSAVFTIAYDATVSISGFTITDGANPAGYGGGVDSEGLLTMTDDIFSGNHASEYGGGVFSNDGTVTLTDDQFSDNYGYYGGGVAVLSTGTVSGDTFSGNTADYGAGLYTAASHSATLTDDTFASNIASGSGGGVLNDGATSLTNVTLASNAATNGEGGALYTDSSSATTTLLDTTLANNTAGLYGAGIFSYASDHLIVGNSILLNSGCAIEVESTPITDAGYNVESENSCGFNSPSRADDSTIDASSTLSSNGSTGPETLALGPGSSAIGIVPAAECTVTTDERGDHRPGLYHSTSCDAGAYEFKSTVPSAPQDVRAVSDKAAATVLWKVPASDGGLALTAYKVFCGKTKGVSLKDKPVDVTKPTVHAVTVSKLTNGVHYYCGVVAVNEQGSSPATKAVEATPRA